MSRKGSLAPAIAADLVRARASGVPWKILEQRYGYGRTRLWMLYKAALGKDVHEHLAPCVDAGGGEGLSDLGCPAGADAYA